jgi:hypothetical protein
MSPSTDAVAATLAPGGTRKPFWTGIIAVLAPMSGSASATMPSSIL